MPRKFIGLSLVLSWGIFVVVAFWVFTYQNLRLFADERDVLARFPEEVAKTLVNVRPLPSEHTGRLVHFWNPECRCSRFSQDHEKEIMTIYGEQGIDFVVAVPDQSLVAQALETFPKASSAVVINQINGFSSPSALVFDAQDTLVYFGPYSEGAFCASSDNTPAELILNDVVSHETVTPWLNLSAFGCYCPWPVH